MNPPNNFSLIIARVLSHTLKNNFVDTFYISPGYRDAPIIAALVEDSSLNLKSVMDERAAAYMALGYVKASGKPCALVCTSGTALANYYPAIIEAQKDQLPLIVISCDRPSELVFNGANQTIDQRKIFSTYVKKSIGLDAPSAATNLHSVYQSVSLLLDIARTVPRGPVHLNVPLSSPLEPTDSTDFGVEQLAAQLSEIKSASWPQTILPEINFDIESSDLIRKILKAERPIFLVGRMNRAQRELLQNERYSSNVPTFYDLGSGLKFQDGLELMDLEIPSVRKLLSDYKPDLFVHFGKRLISKYFDIFLKQNAQIPYIVFSDYEDQQVAEHRVHTRIRFDGAKSLLNVHSSIQKKVYPKIEGLRELKYNLYEKVRGSQFTIPLIAQSTIEMAKDWNYYVANSSVVRAFDSWTFGCSSMICDFEMNRGVSGIEGQLATAIAFSEYTKKKQITFLGDITAIHDLNSFLSLGKVKNSHIVVVLNNSGGHIFDKLPISRHRSVLDPYISTPHNFNFAGIASMAGVSYATVTTIEEYKKVIGKAYSSHQTIIVECVLHSSKDVNLFDSIKGEK